MSSARLRRRLLAPVAAASLFLAPAALHAQSASVIDPRFQPWVGCWRPTDSGVGLEELDGEKLPTRACVVPSTSTAGTVDLMIFHRDSLLSRTTVPIPGKPLARRIDECDGIESAAWTPGNARLVLKAELTCARGVKRVETGLLTMNEAGQWVQFQHLAVGKNEATTVARFRFEGDTVRPAGVDMGAVRSTRALRLAVGGPVEITDIVDAARMIPPSLAEGWLTELGPRVALDAKTLVQLADGGVPSRVIDVMVALANPDRFQIGPAMMNGRGQSQGPAIAALRTGRNGTTASGLRGRCQLYDDFCYGPGGMGAWGMGYRYGMFDPWGYGYFNPYRSGWGLGYNAYSPWGGYGYGYGWGNGVYYGGGPVVIIPNGSGSSYSGDGTVRGRAVSGGGYTRDVAPQPRSSGSYPASASPSGGSMGGASGGSSSGGDGGGRTAKPRGSGSR